MSVRLASAVVLCAVGALAACAPVPSSADRTTTSQNARRCVFQDDVRSFRVSEKGRNVYVRGLDKTVYRLETAGACPELDGALTIGFVPMGGVNSLCVGDYTQLAVGGSPSAMPCRARLTGALTEAEVAALPERDRP